MKSRIDFTEVCSSWKGIEEVLELDVFWSLRTCEIPFTHNPPNQVSFALLDGSGHVFNGERFESSHRLEFDRAFDTSVHDVEPKIVTCRGC